MLKTPIKTTPEIQPLDLTGKRCLIYARASTTDQENSNQIFQLHDYAKRQGWKVVRVIEDICTGGKSAQERQGLKQVFELAHRRQFDILLFWSLDRLSREGTRTTIEYLSTFEKYGVDWHSYSEQYLSSLGLFKDAIIAILSALAKQEKIRISERTKAGLERTRRNGTILGRKPTPQSTIDRVAELRKQGLTFAEIGQQMELTRSRVHQIAKLAVV